MSITELLDIVEDKALDDPTYALADREWFLDPRIYHFRAEEQHSALQPYALPQDFPQFTRNEKLTLLHTFWYIAQSQRQKARNLRRKLDKTCKELRRQQKQSIHSVNLVKSMVHKRAAKTSVHNSRPRNRRSRLDCPICHSTEVNVVTGCGHAFCKECVDHWEDLADSCPTCRVPLVGLHPLYI